MDWRLKPLRAETQRYYELDRLGRALHRADVLDGMERWTACEQDEAVEVERVLGEHGIRWAVSSPSLRTRARRD